MRNFLVTQLLSQGIPMLCGGDEVGRSQGGNNNAYCQDNEISWFSWPVPRAGARLFEFTRRLIRLRLAHPVFHRRRFFQGRRIEGSQVKDLSWFRPDGKEMTEGEWTDWFGRCLGLRLAGDAIEESDEGTADRGRHVPGAAQPTRTCRSSCPRTAAAALGAGPRHAVGGAVAGRIYRGRLVPARGPLARCSGCVEPGAGMDRTDR
jgi:hypothetical protein